MRAKRSTIYPYSLGNVLGLNLSHFNMSRASPPPTYFDHGVIVAYRLQATGYRLQAVKYKKRKEIVEPVFGPIKNSGFRGFHLRGHKKASGEFSLVCAVHNFKKIVGAVLRGEVRLETGKMGAVAA